MPLIPEITDLYPLVISQLETEFSSHEFILELARDHQKIYIDALYSYRESKTPFRSLHVEMAHALSQHCDHLGEVDSVNIFGDRNQCGKWKQKK